MASIRSNYDIPPYRKPEGHRPKVYTVEQAAELFAVNRATIMSWINIGILKADQITEGAPWQIFITEEDRKRLTAQSAPDGWLSLEDAAAQCGVSKQTVLNWVKERKVQYVRVNHGRRKCLRIDASSVSYRTQPSLFS